MRRYPEEEKKIEKDKKKKKTSPASVFELNPRADIVLLSSGTMWISNDTSTRSRFLARLNPQSLSP